MNRVSICGLNHLKDDTANSYKNDDKGGKRKH